MKSYLVDFSFTTRVVVPDSFLEEQILAAAKENLKIRLTADSDGEILNAAGQPQEDVESPYDPIHDTSDKFGVYPDPLATTVAPA